ncbi:MAG: hypothetical protein KUA37_00045 [Desulfomicrobium sp.]|nr:hypothetical protein [Pseudomonadota bacterium]MBV1710381.1 hypothetical protein [Desulfomicrobium sp.]MBU4570002.1 hypothetical protein [Pseudomonadota bacterium]MBU4593920.1 hypothetical protein [Pseudomonadota bacterium]MBV1721053.1 hypothetical protein [Desulfomicrobium sp.]
MQEFINFSILLKIIGALSVGIGSILLALRVKSILQWVVFCLVAHEQSIHQLSLIAKGQVQSEPVVIGVTKHLIEVESKVGVILFVAGFCFLGIGMLCNAVSYLVDYI